MTTFAQMNENFGGSTSLKGVFSAWGKLPERNTNIAGSLKNLFGQTTRAANDSHAMRQEPGADVISTRVKNMISNFKADSALHMMQKMAEQKPSLFEAIADDIHAAFSEKGYGFHAKTLASTKVGSEAKPIIPIIDDRLDFGVPA